MFKNWVVWTVTRKDLQREINALGLNSAMSAYWRGDRFFIGYLKNHYTVLCRESHRLAWLVTYKQFPYSLLRHWYDLGEWFIRRYFGFIYFLVFRGIIDEMHGECDQVTLKEIFLWPFVGLWHRIVYRNDPFWAKKREENMKLLNYGQSLKEDL